MRASGAGTTIENYPAALAAIGDVFSRHLDLPKPDAALVLFANRRSFEAALLSFGYPAKLAREASTFRAIGGARAVLVNESGLDDEPWRDRVRLLAHELTHSVQYRFSGGTRGASDQWLREGMADWVACRTVDVLGYQTYRRCRDSLLDRLTLLAPETNPVPLEELSTFPQWVAAQQGHADVPLYTQAFLFAEYLVERRGLAAFVDYFSRFAKSSDREANFRKAFGITLRRLEPDLQTHWHHETIRRRLARGAGEDSR
jgi:hypothetical protein